MHLVRADLHLEGSCPFVHHSRIEGLVAVWLGVGDEIVELVWERVPHAVHYSQSVVAFRHSIDQDSNGNQVVYVIEIFAHRSILLDLLVYAVNMLGPAGDLGFHAGLLKLVPESAYCLSDEGFALHALGIQQPLDVLILPWLEVLETQVFKLILQFPYPDTG